MNYRLIAIQAGDALKYTTTINQIDRAAKSVFSFVCENFPNEAISSIRAQTIHNWILSLAKQSLSLDERNTLLTQFLNLVTPEDQKEEIDRILSTANIDKKITDEEGLYEFIDRKFHSLINQHCRQLFRQKNYFHAVFEAAKVYNKFVQQKAESEKDGAALMLEVWSQNGVLKLNTGQTQTEKDIQDGVMFLSTGLMRALRNPTAHEPALDWPISREDCLDMLSFISYLFRQLDKSVHFSQS